MTRKPRPRAFDPMEQLIEDALLASRTRFVREGTPGTNQRLDFYLLDHDLYIEVKRLHSPRIDAQLASQPNIIAAQGEMAVRFLAQAIRTGLVGGPAPAAPPPHVTHPGADR